MILYNRLGEAGISGGRFRMPCKNYWTGRLVAFVVLTALGANCASAQTPATGDSRRLVPPQPPSICKTLPAQLQSGPRVFSSRLEHNPPDTTRIQSAMNACTQAPGRPSVAVLLSPSGLNNAFLSGPLVIPSGVVLLLARNVTLFASNNPSSYQISSKSPCGTVETTDDGCAPFIAVAGDNAGIMGAPDTESAEPTPSPRPLGTIDGRGDVNLYGQSISWWDVSTAAYSAHLKQNNPRMIEAHNVNNFTLASIRLINAPLSHVYFEGGDGFTAWGVRIKTPANTHNTDGIDSDSATNITITHCDIQDGDDGVAIKTNSGTTSNITVANSNFYGTHGISIGSQTQYGVSNVLVSNNTISGMDSSGILSSDNNGIRIKTDSSSGGPVTQVLYTGICMTNVKHAIVFTPFYSKGNNSTIPDLTNIVVNSVKSVNSPPGASSLLEGYSAMDPLGLIVENVQLDAPLANGQYATIGLFNTNLNPAGFDVITYPYSGAGSVPACSQFPVYPPLE